MPLILSPLAEEMTFEIMDDSDRGMLSIPKWKRRIEGEHQAQEISDDERNRMYQLLRRLDVH